MFYFILNQPVNDSIGAQLAVLIEVLKKIKAENKKYIIFDFSKIKFVYPVFITSISSLIAYLKENGYEVYHSGINNSSYLQTVFFPDGLKPDELPLWETTLNNYSGKTYLPVINFSASRKKEETEIRENVLSKINSLLENNLKLNSNYKTAVSYIISEITDNIIDHSGVGRGWISAQYYPTKQFLDICIIDTGKTILGSYKDNNIAGINNDFDAIEKAISGVSTKDKERGFGMRTSKKLIEEGLNGKFVLISGSAMLFNNELTQFPVKWEGTILALRMPQGIANFDYSHFLLV